jgi:hypothetical protein
MHLICWPLRMQTWRHDPQSAADVILRRRDMRSDINNFMVQHAVFLQCCHSRILSLIFGGSLLKCCLCLCWSQNVLFSRKPQAFRFVFFLRQWIIMLRSSMLCHRLVWYVVINVSEGPPASILRLWIWSSEFARISIITCHIARCYMLQDHGISNPLMYHDLNFMYTVHATCHTYVNLQIILMFKILSRWVYSCRRFERF